MQFSEILGIWVSDPATTPLPKYHHLQNCPHNYKYHQRTFYCKRSVTKLSLVCLNIRLTDGHGKQI